jgi:hypothetical protein
MNDIFLNNDGNDGSALGGNLTGYLDTGLKSLERIKSISDAKKKREYEFALSNLNLEDKRKLNNELLRAKSNEERFAILTNAKSELEKSRQEQKAKNNLKLAVIIIGGGIVLLFGAYLIKKM